MSFQLIHRWVGAVLCATVLLISVTGTLLIWKPEYLWLTIPSAQDSVDRNVKHIAIAAEKIEATYRPGEVRFIQLHSDNLAIHKVFLSDKRYAWHNQVGEQLELWKANERWEDWLLDLHHRFLLGNTIGLNIAGLSGLLLIPLSLIGLLLWWPWRRFLKLDVRPKNSTHKAWVVSHSNLGVWSLLPILLLAFTGAVLVYPTESRWLLVNGFGDPKPPIEIHEASSVELRWLSAMEYVQHRYPDSTLRWLSPLDTSQSGSDGGVLKVGLQQANEWNRSGSTSVRFRPSSIEVRDGLAQALAKRGIDFTYPLHTGKLGLAYRILLALFGLMLVMVSAFGLGAFIKGYRSI